MNKNALLLGILPVVLYTIVEEYYGVIWGLVAGLVLGFFEIIWEFKTERRVSGMTWFGNGMLFVLGGISLVTKEGIWFKLQPAIMEFAFALFLWGTLLFKKNIMELMLEKQKMQVPDEMKAGFKGMTFRMGLFLFFHGLLATWAALYWSTKAWALLKGVGFTLSFIFYMFIEGLVLRLRIERKSS